MITKLLVQSINTNRQRIPSPLEKGFEKDKLRFVSLAANVGLGVLSRSGRREQKQGSDLTAPQVCLKSKTGFCFGIP